MEGTTRRQFLGAAAALGAVAASAVASDERNGTRASFARGALPVASPESVGFSSERLARLDDLMQRVIDAGEYAGVITLVARHGKVIHLKATGKADLAPGTPPLAHDTIFRIFSMTKPVTAVAMMMLYEEGKWHPQDPIAKHIPEFANLQVFRGVDDGGKVLTEAPAHPPTLRELMTMTAGFTYGSEQTPLDRLYRDEQDRHILLSGSLQAMIDRLARAPLLFQPSSQWKYGLSADIQGYIVERLAGQSFPRFLQERLFGPLGMRDTAFHVPREKRSRLAAFYQMGAQGRLGPIQEARYRDIYGEFDREPAIPMGGGGLVGTIQDYFRFAQMLLSGGQLDGVRILAPSSVRLMMANHLADSLMASFKGGGSPFDQPRPGLGYGFNGAAVTDPGQADMPLGKGSYYWNGAAGTWFWVDPTHDIVVVGMTQRLRWWIHDNVMGLPPNLEQLSQATIYQALLRP